MTELPLPTRPLTFVFTDVVGSTRLWEADDAAMREAMRRHDEIIETAVADFGGHVIRPRGEGDSRFLVFEGPGEALLAAAAIQRTMAQEWRLPEPLVVRIGIHTGSAQFRDGDYYGSSVNRCARIRGVAHGEQVLISNATTALVQDSIPKGLSTLDLGEHRLRDLTRPERLHQLVGEGLRRDFPPLASLSAVANNLPVQVSDLVGRSRELQQVRTLLGAHRMVTIVAPGGSGKTRLAVQVAAEMAADYQDGVFFVGLTPLSDAHSVPVAIAEGLGLSLAGDQEVEEQLAGYLRGKHRLLVLDNFEHVRDAGPVIARLLESAPGVTVLITSRSQVGVTGETVFALEGLSIEWPAGEGPVSADGARLFVETAERRVAGFTLTEADRPSLHEILQRTDGSPLAILLAATWVDVLSVTEIAAELRKSLDFLESEMADLPPRHRSVRAVFDYSWALLTPVEQSLFAKLSIFRGGFTREAADRVAGASLKDLSRLVRQSLVTSDHDRERFAVHGLLGEFGAERLAASGDAEATTDAYIEYFGDVTERVDADMQLGRQTRALEVMGADLDNLRSVWRLAIGRGCSIPASYVRALWFWHEVHGPFRPALELLAEAARGYENAETDDLRRIAALARAACGWFLGLLGDTQAGVAECDAAALVLDEVGTAGDMAFMVNCIGISLISQEEARRLVHECDRAYRRAVDAGETWWGLSCVAWAAHGLFVLGDLDEAERRLDEAQPAYESIGDQFLLIWIYEGRANIARSRGELMAARRFYERVLDLAERLGHGRAIHYNVNNLGRISEDVGDNAAAITYYLRSLRLSHDLGQRADVAGNLLDIARARMAAADLRGAAAILAVLTTDEIGAVQRRYAPAPVADLATELHDRLPNDPAVTAAIEDGRARGLEATVAGLLAEGA